MVGAARSNRCDACRRRKVKCDEDWPICGPCRRGNRTCPARPALKFVDDGARVCHRMQAATKRRDNKSGSTGASASTHTSPHISSNGSCLSQSREDIRINDSMPLTQSEKLCFAFISSLELKNRSYNLSVMGEFVWHMPQRLGKSNALDSVTACLLAAHKKLLRGGDQSEMINPDMYSSALRSVRKALVDPQSWRSTNTLCATVLLHRLEVIFGNVPNPNIRVHAAGLAALQQKRGPPGLGDLLEFQATVDSHISITQSTIMEGKDCFLASDKWATALDVRNGRTELQMVYYRLMRQMTYWPKLTRENFELRRGNPAVSTNEVLERARKVLVELANIGHAMDKLLHSKHLIAVTQSNGHDDPVSTMFEVKDNLVAMLICHHAMYSIIILRIVLSLLRREVHEQKESSQIEEEILCQCRRAWMLIDYSRSNKPLGLPIMQSTLLFTYDCVTHQATQRRILATMNELDGIRIGNRSWQGDRVSYIAKIFLGECSPIQYDG